MSNGLTVEEIRAKLDVFEQLRADNLEADTVLKLAQAVKVLRDSGYGRNEVARLVGFDSLADDDTE